MEITQLSDSVSTDIYNLESDVAVPAGALLIEMAIRKICDPMQARLDQQAAELTRLQQANAALVDKMRDCKEFLDDEDIDLRSRVTNCQLAIDLALAKS